MDVAGNYRIYMRYIFRVFRCVLLQVWQLRLIFPWRRLVHETNSGMDTELKYTRNTQGSVPVYWNRNAIILTEFSSLVALEVVKMTTSSAASDENFIKMTFPLQCYLVTIIMITEQLIFTTLKWKCSTCWRNFHHWLHRSTRTSSKSRMSHIITLITRPCTNIDDMFNSGVKSFQRVIVISISRVERLYGKTKVICTCDIYMLYIYMIYI